MTTNQVVERLLQALEGAEKQREQPYVKAVSAYVGPYSSMYGYLSQSVRCLIEELAGAK